MPMTSQAPPQKTAPERNLPSTHLLLLALVFGSTQAPDLTLLGPAMMKTERHLTHIEMRIILNPSKLQSRLLSATRRWGLYWCCISCGSRLLFLPRGNRYAEDYGKFCLLPCPYPYVAKR